MRDKDKKTTRKVHIFVKSLAPTHHTVFLIRLDSLP